MNTGAYIVLLAVAILLFLALREVFCWYYKINKMIELQTKQNELLKQIVNKLYERKFE